MIKSKRIRPLLALTVVLSAALPFPLKGFAEDASVGQANSTNAATASSPSTLPSLQVIDVSKTNLSDLNLAVGQSAILDFTHAGSLSLSGNLQNAGILYAVSAGGNSATIQANNIFNLSGGTITTVLPSAGFAGFNNLYQSLNLSLIAVNDIVNAGLISSAGNLSITAGNTITNSPAAAAASSTAMMTAASNLMMQASQIVNQGTITSQLANVMATANVLTNSGVMQALNGNMTIQSLSHTLDVNNLMGTLSAKNELLIQTLGTRPFSGDVNAALANINLTGGILESDKISFLSPSGLIAVNADQLNGPVHIAGGLAAVTSNSDLMIGSLNLTGDPIFASKTGDLDLSGIFSSGQFKTNGGDFIALAYRDVIAPALVGAATIDATNSAPGAKGGYILIYAGLDNIIVGNASCSNCAGQWGWTGQSTSGGDIKLSQVNLKTNSNEININALKGIDRPGNLAIGNIESAGAGGAPVTWNNFNPVNGNPGMDGGNIVVGATGTISTGYLRAYGGGGSGAIYNLAFRSVLGGNGGRGGEISVTNTSGDITINGDVNASGGGGGGAGYFGDNIFLAGKGGDGGSVYIRVGPFNTKASGNILIEGPVLAAGGGGGGGTQGGGGSFGGGGGSGLLDTGNWSGFTGGGGGIFGGGAAGHASSGSWHGGGGGLWGGADANDVAGGYGYGAFSATVGDLTKSPFGIGAFPRNESGGNVGQKGGGSSTPWGGEPGNGGTITIQVQNGAGSINVSKTIGSYYGFTDSIYKNVSVSVAGPNGQINIGLPDGGATSSPQFLSDANYGVSPSSTYSVDLVGSSLTTIGDVDGSTINMGPTTYNNHVDAGVFWGLREVGITIDSVVHKVGINDKVTAAEWVALVQATRGGQTVQLTGGMLGGSYASGGSITVNAANVPNTGFSNLVLPANVTLHGNTDLFYSGTATIDGQVNLMGNLVPQQVFSASSISGAGQIVADKIALTATNGSIGSQGTPMRMSINQLYLTNALGSTFIDNNKGLIIGSVDTKGTASMKVQGNLMAGDLNLVSAPRLNFDVAGDVQLGNVTVAGAGGAASDTVITTAQNGVNGGELKIKAGGNVVTGAIQAYGGGGGGAVASQAGNGGSGGVVRIETPAMVTINGAVNVSGGGGGGQGEQGGGGNGGAAGSIYIEGTTSVSIAGPVLAAGGGGGGAYQSGSGVGGGGGSFGGGGGAGSSLLRAALTRAGSGGGPAAAGTGGGSMQSFERGGGGGGGLSAGGAGGNNAAGDGFATNGGMFFGHANGGGFGKGGQGDGAGGGAGGDVATAGVGSGAGSAGAGGDINIQSFGAISISKTVDQAFSISSADYGGLSVSAAGLGGKINILTQSPGSISGTVYFADANFAQGANTYAASVSGPNAGASIAGSLTAPDISVQNQLSSGTMLGGSFAGQNYFEIVESGANVRIYSGAQVTPAEWVAAIQAAGGGQTLTLATTTPGKAGSGYATGGLLNVSSGVIPGGGFTNLNLPASVTQNVFETSITYSGAATVDGDINFLSNDISFRAASISGMGGFFGRNSVSLTATSGSIGSMSSPLAVRTDRLSANATSGSVFLNTYSKSGSQMVLPASNVQGTFYLSDKTGEGYRGFSGSSISASTLVLSSQGGLGSELLPISTNASKLNLYSQGGSVYVNDTYNGTIDLDNVANPNSAADVYLVNATLGGIHAKTSVVGTNKVSLLAAGQIQRSASVDLRGQHVVLQGSSIGTSAVPMSVIASKLTANAGSGSVYIQNQLIGGTLQLVDVPGLSNGASGDYEVNSPSTNIELVNAVSTTIGTVTLQTGGSLLNGGGVLNGKAVLSAKEIGQSSSFIQTNSRELTLTTTDLPSFKGGAYIMDFRSLGTTLKTSGVFVNKVAGDLVLTNSGAGIAIQDNISAGRAFLTASSGAISGSGVINAATVELVGGSVGSQGQSINTAAANLTFNASTGGVFVNNNYALGSSLKTGVSTALTPNKAATVFQVNQSSGNLDFKASIEAQKIVLTVSNASSLNGGSVAGPIALLGQEVVLGAGSIGSSASPLVVNTSKLTAAASSADVHIINLAATNLVLSDSSGPNLSNGAKGVFSLEQRNGSVRVDSPVTAQSIVMKANGSISGTGKLSSDTLVLDASAIGNSSSDPLTTAVSQISAHAKNGSVFVSNQSADLSVLEQSGIANSATANFWLNQTGNLNLISDLSAPIMELSADGYIDKAGASVLYAPQLTISAAKIGNDNRPVITASQNLTFTARSGSVDLWNTPLPGNKLAVSGTAFGYLTLRDLVGDMQVVGDITAGGTALISATGNMQNTGSATVKAPSVVLFANGTQGIGLPTAYFLVDTGEVTGSAPNGSVWIKNVGITPLSLKPRADLGIPANTAAGDFQVQTAGKLNVEGTVTTGQFIPGFTPTPNQILPDGSVSKNGSIGLTAGGDVFFAPGVSLTSIGGADEGGAPKPGNVVISSGGSISGGDNMKVTSYGGNVIMGAKTAVNLNSTGSKSEIEAVVKKEDSTSGKIGGGIGISAGETVSVIEQKLLNIMTNPTANPIYTNNVVISGVALVQVDPSRVQVPVVTKTADGITSSEKTQLLDQSSFLAATALVPSFRPNVQTDLLPDQQITPNTLSGHVATNQNAQPSPVFTDGTFDANSISLFSSNGVQSQLGSNGQSLNLQHGSIFFAPKQDVSVTTPAGIVHIEAGSLALVIANGGNVSIYNFHDERTGAVRMVSAGSNVALPPGSHALFTTNSKSDFNTLNGNGSIAFRNVERSTLQNGVVMFSADFSIISALMNNSALHTLSRAGNAEMRSIREKMLKTAAALQIATGGSRSLYHQVSDPKNQ